MRIHVSVAALAVLIAVAVPAGLPRAQTAVANVADESVRVLEEVGQRAETVQNDTEHFMAEVGQSVRNIAVMIKAISTTEEGSVEGRYLAAKSLKEIEKIYGVLINRFPGYLRHVEDLSEEMTSARFQMRRLSGMERMFDDQRDVLVNQQERCRQELVGLVEQMKGAKREGREISEDLIYVADDKRDCVIERRVELTSLAREEKLTKTFYSTIGIFESRLSRLARKLARDYRKQMKEYTAAIRDVRLSAGGSDASLAKASQMLAHLQTTLQKLNKIGTTLSESLTVISGEMKPNVDVIKSLAAADTPTAGADGKPPEVKVEEYEKFLHDNPTEG